MLQRVDADHSVKPAAQQYFVATIPLELCCLNYTPAPSSVAPTMIDNYIVSDLWLPMICKAATRGLLENGYSDASLYKHGGMM